MADIQFIPKARNANAIPNEPFSNGSLIAATDTGELYVDYNGARMRIGDVITLETDAQRLATLAPLPKLYWVAETGKLWRFANDWVCVNPDDIEADTVKADIVQAGRRYYNVATVVSRAYVYEIVIKTRIPKADQASVNAIYLYGVCGNHVVNTMFSTYWQNDSVKFPWRNMVQAGSISFEGKIFTYEDDGTEYVGIALLPGTTGLGAQTSIYYPHFQVDFTDLMGSIRDYSKGWTVELNTVKNSESIIPQTNIMDCIKSKLVTDIYGSATNAEQLAGVDGELYTCSYVGRIANEPNAYYKNLDDAIRHGGYVTSGIPAEINCPIPPRYSSISKLYGKLWVDVSNGTTGTSNNWVWQTWQSTTGAIYRRQQINGGAWTDWVAIATGGLLYPPDNAGINSLGTPTITEISCIPEMLADRLQFFPATKCMAETSTDGTSWTTKTVSASQWNSLLCCNPSYLAGLTWDNGTQLRLTFTYNTYVMLSMLYLYVDTDSRLKVVIERYRNSTQDWVELASMGGIVGQPQHVSLWHDAVRFTNTAKDSYSSQVRVTLIHEGNSTDTPRIDMLRWKGGYPAVNPYIYSWNPSKAVTFPNTVTATNFIGQWSGKTVASSFDENSTTTVPTCKQVADYVKSLIGG